MKRSRIRLTGFDITVLSGILFLIVMMSVVTIAYSEEEAELELDLNRSQQYELVYDENGVSIWYTNTNYYHFFFIESPNGWTGDLLVKTNHSTYNFGHDLQLSEISSLHTNVTAEVRMTLRVGNALEFRINGKDIKLTVEPEFVTPPPSPWTGWTVTIIVVMVWVGSNGARNLRKKQYIEAYRQETLPDGRIRISSTLEVVGEWKNENPNHDKGCVDFEMRKGTERFLLHSNSNYSDYKSYHCVKNYFWIRFLINAQVYDKPLAKPRTEQLGWSKKANFMRFWLVVFNWNFYSVLASPFICILTLSFMFPNFPPIIAIGWGVGWGLNTVVYYQQKRGKWIPKRKNITVTKERYISPLESEYLISDVYEVEGFKTTTIETKDGARQAERKPFKKQVVDYEKLYEMRNDERYDITRWVVVDQIRMKRTPEEMKTLTRSYLARNREMSERIFTLRKRNAELKKQVKNLTLEKELIAETQQAELMDTLTRMDSMRKQRQNTLIKIFEDRFGRAFVRDNLDSSVERAERIIQDERDRARADKMQELVDLMYKLIDMIGSKADLRTESLRNLMKLKEMMGDENDGGNTSTDN